MELSEIDRNKNVKKINAPFGYFGSKNKIALQLCTHLPPHSCWVEAFCGSAALTLRKPLSPIEIINDLDDDIINFFEQLRNNRDSLIKAVELTPYAEKELLKSRIETDTSNNIERARRFLVQSMMAVNGAFGNDKGGFSYSDSYSRNGHEARVNRWNNLPERLERVTARLKKVRIENKDANKLIKRFINRPATLIYLDPPYLTERTNGYTKDANDEEFHIRLLELANKAECMIFISAYENELYNSLLSIKRGWTKATIPTITKGTDGNNQERTELVWMNKYYQKALLSNRVPIVLSEKEKKQGKVNPVR